MSYIDGYLIPVTAGNKEAYRDMATKAAALLKEFGATRIVDDDDCCDEGNAHIRKASLISSVPPWGLLPSTLEPVVENMGDPLIPAVISSSKWREVADHVLRHLTN